MGNYRKPEETEKIKEKVLLSAAKLFLTKGYEFSTVKRFLKTTFKIYDVPKEKIEETIAFVSQFDYPKIAKATIDSMLGYLEKNI